MGKRRMLTLVALPALITVSLVIVSARPAPTMAPRHSQPGQVSTRRATAQPAEAMRSLPLAFEPNRGQADRHVRFLARGAGYVLFLTDRGAVIDVAQSPVPGHRAAVMGPMSPPVPAGVRSSAVDLSFVDANPHARIIALDRLPGRVNYFSGDDPHHWQVDIPTYARVEYQGLYPGVSLVYYGRGGSPEYDLIVAPGAKLDRVRFRFSDARSVGLDRQGDVLIRAGAVLLRQRQPVVYQRVGHTTNRIPARYRFTANGDIAISIGAHLAGRPVVIDPRLTFSTFLGGFPYNYAAAIAVDARGEAYVTGATMAPDFPRVGAKPKARSRRPPGVYVAKFNAAGTALLYTSFLSGESLDYAQAIAVNGVGDAFVAGSTTSYHFPTVNAPQRLKGQGLDAWVTRLSPAGDRIIYSTYLGGDRDDAADGIAVDGAGNAYVVGTTNSVDFPTAGPVRTRRHGSGPCPSYGAAPCPDAFVTKLNPSGTVLVYSRYLGGSNNDEGSGIAVDGAGDAFVTGTTRSLDFPAVAAFQPKLGGGTCYDTQPTPCTDAFVTELNPSGSRLIFSTYLGGRKDDAAAGIALDHAGDAYVTGYTDSKNFPLRRPLQRRLEPSGCGSGCIADDRGDAFVTELRSSHTALVYSSFLGGSGGDSASGIAVDRSGSATVIGDTNSRNFPIVGFRKDGLYHELPGHAWNVFATRLQPAGAGIAFSTEIGGWGDTLSASVAVDSAGNTYLTGTAGAGFPLKHSIRGGPSRNWQTLAFVLKLGARPVVPPSATPVPGPGTRSPSPVPAAPRPTPSAAPTPTGSTKPVRADTLANGVDLALILPRTIYPKDALVPATVKLRNVSRQSVQVVTNQCPGGLYPVVIDRLGAPLYPPAVPGANPMSCGAPRSLRLAPGRTLTTTSFVILRADRMRAEVHVLSHGILTDMQGKPIAVVLGSGRRPRVVLHTSPSVYAVVTPRSVAHGPLLWSGWWRCRGKSGTDSSAGGITFAWQKATANRLQPDWVADCSSHREWHAVAGWQGQPVVAINYVHH